MINEKKPKVKILVCCHKPDKWLSDDVYMPIQCGKAISDLDLGIQGDDIGDNISIKNKSYCELTALYWTWKNLKDVDYVGLCHYRRYFDFKSIGASVRLMDVDKMLYSDVIQFDSSCMNNIDVILPKFWSLPHSVRTEFLPLVLFEDIHILLKVVRKMYPSYLNTMECYLLGNKRTGYNMFIMNRDIFLSYSEWLFNILFEMEKYVVLSSYWSYKRVFGFCGEILLPVYCIHNGLKMKENRIVFVADKNRLNTLGKKHIKNILNDISYSFKTLAQKEILFHDYMEKCLIEDRIFI